MRRFAITSGDPCGIGPEIILKAFSQLPTLLRRRLIVIGDHAVFERAARRSRTRLPSWRRLPSSALSSIDDTQCYFLDCAHRSSFVFGQPTKAAGQAALTYLDLVLKLWRAGQIGGCVTGPVTKWAIAQAHHGFVGQTEYFAQELRAREVAMMFAADHLRVVLLTRHVPLAQVSRRVTRALIRSTLRLTHQALRSQFRIPRPRIGICGLNPHAGEGGLFGQEERQVLLPVLRELQAQGIRCEGPFAADGFFAAQPPHDAIVCWYHDQALIPFKMAARDQGCQVTLGLPMVRTAPDHGSALDIAGQGVAHPGSMLYAVRLAAQLLK